MGVGYIYLLEPIVVEKHGLSKSACGYKIGRSVEVTKRLCQINPRLPWRVAVKHSLASGCYEKAEKYLHTKYADYRMNGEWFSLPDTEVEWICGLRDGAIDELLGEIFSSDSFCPTEAHKEPCDSPRQSVVPRTKPTTPQVPNDLCFSFASVRPAAHILFRRKSPHFEGQGLKPRRKSGDGDGLSIPIIVREPLNRVPALRPLNPPDELTTSLDALSEAGTEIHPRWRLNLARALKASTLTFLRGEGILGAVTAAIDRPTVSRFPFKNMIEIEGEQ